MTDSGGIATAIGNYLSSRGLLLLIGRYVPLGLTLLGPVIVNILLFHSFLDTSLFEVFGLPTHLDA